MNLSKLLNQALSSSALKQVTQKVGSSSSSLGGGDTLKKMGMGAVGGSLLTSLLKSGKGSTLLKVGGAAAVGALAYKVYNDYQKEKAQPQQTEVFHETDQQHPTIILKAMIAAAKADGHIDATEMARIHEALAQANIGADEQAFLEGEINKPLDPTEIAALAKTPALASEIYLASLLVVDEQNAMEAMYLNELARQLKLDTEMQKRLALASGE